LRLLTGSARSSDYTPPAHEAVHWVKTPAMPTRTTASHPPCGRPTGLPEATGRHLHRSHAAHLPETTQSPRTGAPSLTWNPCKVARAKQRARARKARCLATRQRLILAVLPRRPPRNRHGPDGLTASASHRNARPRKA